MDRRSSFLNALSFVLNYSSINTEDARRQMINISDVVINVANAYGIKITKNSYRFPSKAKNISMLFVEMSKEEDLDFSLHFFHSVMESNIYDNIKGTVLIFIPNDRIFDEFANTKLINYINFALFNVSGENALMTPISYSDGLEKLLYVTSRLFLICVFLELSFDISEELSSELNIFLERFSDIISVSDIRNLARNAIDSNSLRVEYEKLFLDYDILEFTKSGCVADIIKEYT